MDLIFGLFPASLPYWVRVAASGGIVAVALIGSLDVVLGEIDR